VSDDESVVMLWALEIDDAEWIFEACQDADIQRWTLVPRPYLREHAESFVREGVGELSTWAIVDDDDARPVGMISIHSIADGVASIGYWVAPWGRGRGAASAAVRRVIEMARAMGARAVTADIAEANVASRRTVERCGFTVASIEPLVCRDNGVAVNSLRYRLDL
jgi:RimJ/RimL family protein N-acetyltransferase